MSKKIVAIGGGSNGVYKDGYNEPNTNAPIIKEIINLTGKKNPTFLYIAHTMPSSILLQKIYYSEFKDMVNKLYDCDCLFLSTNDIKNPEYAKLVVDMSDIIYEEGGNTKIMMYMWEKYNFDSILKNAYESGTVMSGLSAGANCWFKKCSTDSLSESYGGDEPFTTMDCLGFHEGFFVPHCDESERIKTAKAFLKENNMVGFYVSNGAALEIVDDKYRILSGTPEYFATKPYAKKAYWDNDEYFEEPLDMSKEYKDVQQLLRKKVK